MKLKTEKLKMAVLLSIGLVTPTLADTEVPSGTQDNAVSDQTLKLKMAMLLSLSLAAPLAAAAQDSAAFHGTLGAPVSEHTLADERGKALLTNINDLDGNVYANSADDTVTGSNFITDGSFTGNSGASTVIQNSGNNVLIQNALILNVQLQ